MCWGGYWYIPPTHNYHLDSSIQGAAEFHEKNENVIMKVGTSVNAYKAVFFSAEQLLNYAGTAAVFNCYISPDEHREINVSRILSHITTSS